MVTGCQKRYLTVPLPQVESLSVSRVAYHLVDATSREWLYTCVRVGLLVYGYDCRAGAHGLNRLLMIAGGTATMICFAGA